MKWLIGKRIHLEPPNNASSVIAAHERSSKTECSLLILAISCNSEGLGLIVVQMFYLGFKPLELSENINRDEKC